MQFCSSCGTPVPAGSASCPQCKQAIASTVHPGSPASPGPGGNFFASLLDFSFSSFVTERLIKVLYALAFVGAAFLYISMVLAGFAAGSGSGILALLILGPLAALLVILWARVTLEVLIVLFRIADHTREIAQEGRARAVSAH